MPSIEELVSHQANVVTLCFPDGFTADLRYLSYAEYRTFKTLYERGLNSSFLDEVVTCTVCLNECMQDPVWRSEQRAGVFTTIAGLVMYLASDHIGPDLEQFHNMLNTARHMSSSMENTIFAVICHTFPGYRVQHLEKLTWPEILSLFASAENILLQSGQLAEYITFGGVSPTIQPTQQPTQQQMAQQGMEIDYQPEKGQVLPDGRPDRRIKQDSRKTSIQKGQKLVVSNAAIRMSQAFDTQANREAIQESKDRQRAWAENFLQKKLPPPKVINRDLIQRIQQQNRALHRKVSKRR